MFRATCSPINAIVAVKKSRVSLRVQRTFLKHEARILGLLQGHSAFPKLVGYGRGPHFEHLAMELLGSRVKEKMQAGKALSVQTVAQIGEQMVRSSSIEPKNPATVAFSSPPSNIFTDAVSYTVTSSPRTFCSAHRIRLRSV